MQDKFSTYSGGLTAPATEAVAVVPSDEDQLDWASRAIYVGSTGSLRATMLSGDTVDFTQIQGGMVYPLRVRKIWADGTDAGGIVALR